MKLIPIKKYVGSFHIASPLNEAKQFTDNLQKAIAELQNDNQTVEVQYQQSDEGFSALVLGYKMIKVEA